MEIYGYKRSYARTILTWIAIVASGFLLRLMFFWKPHWMLYMTFKRCSLREAEKVLLIDKYNQCFVERVSHLHGVPHPSELVQRKGTYYNNNNNSITCQDDDDDILECPDKDQFDGHQSASSHGGNNYGSTSKTASNQYGSLAPRVPFRVASPSERRRKRTLSSRSNKSAALTENESDARDSSSSSSSDDLSDSDSLSVSQDGDCQADDARRRPGTPTTPMAHGQLGSQELSRHKDNQDQDLERGEGEREDRDEEQDRDDGGIRYFDNKKLRYIWYEDECNFVRLRGYDKHTPYSKLQKMTDGLTKEEQARRRTLFGDNAIHVEVLPYVKILFQEVLGPFYIFQVFSCTVWFNDDYYYYGSCIIVMSILSLVSSVIQIRRNQEQLRDTVESLDYVKVCRGRDQIEEIDSSQLVPGDIVVVPTFNSVLQFDGILINGNVIVNESMLTGESVPVTKTPLPLSNYTTTTTSKSSSAGAAAATVAAAAAAAKQRNEMYYDEKEHGKHTLFCGTKVLQTRYYGGVHVKALVIRVGFQTAKGELIRSIMFPKPVDFRFSKQIHKFIGLLACIAMIGFTYSVVLKSHRGADFKTILISALDLITIVVPPALPAAMTIGIIYAQSRLMKNKIFCISPRSINISGCINCVCFDKTGTLTEDDLSFNEVVPLIESSCKFGRPFDEEVMQTSLKQVERDHHLLLDSGNYSPLMICLAACHSLTIIDQKLIGDPLDLQMFEATGWVLEEPDVDDENKFDLLAPTVVRPPRRKRRTAPEASEYASSAEFPSSGSSTDEDELQMQMQLQQQQQQQKQQQGRQLDVVSVNTTQKCQSDVGILRQFPFSSSLQRMSVIARQFSGSQYVVYAKGAPEKIASLCDPATMPDDFNEVLHDYTQKGFRVLALAYRPLKVGLSYTRMQRATRADIEKDLKFLGLLTLGNLLKPETIPVISTLNRASIRCVMVTGDNMLTAVSVANECGMIASHDRTVLLQVDKVNKKQQGGGGSEQITPVPSREHLQTVPEATLTNNSAGATIIAVGGGGGAGDDQSANDGKPQQVLDYELPRPATGQLLTSEQSTLPTSGGAGSGDGNVNQLVLSVESIQLQTRTESEPILAQKRTKDPPRPKLIWNYINDSSPNTTTNNNNNSSTNNNHMVKRDSGHSLGGRCGGCVRIDMLEDTRIHLALTGETWDVILRHYPELLNAICVRGTVFARMSPHQKQQLVEHLQTLQYYVGMCGDGANDSGALRAAHAGISLSDTEASVAAPFTSANANISCVPILIGEGRAALVTAFGILKYMALYSLIQFCSVLLLYTMYTNFTDKEFLYEDLFIIATFVALFGRTEPYPTLANKPPPSSLLSVTQLASVSIQLVLVIFFQVLSLVLLWNNDWYKPHPQNYDHDLAGHDNYAIFAISAFQCISLAVVFSKGKPYKKSIMSNYLFTGALAVITVTTITILIIRAEWNIPYISLEVLDVSLDFRLLMILLAFAHFALAMLGERYIVDHLIFEKSDKFLELFGMKSKKSLFESIDQKTRSSMHWLKMSTKDSIVSGL